MNTFFPTLPKPRRAWRRRQSFTRRPTGSTSFRQFSSDRRSDRSTRKSAVKEIVGEANTA